MGSPMVRPMHTQQGQLGPAAVVMNEGITSAWGPKDQCYGVWQQCSSATHTAVHSLQSPVMANSVL